MYLEGNPVLFLSPASRVHKRETDLTHHTVSHKQQVEKHTLFTKKTKNGSICRKVQADEGGELRGLAEGDGSELGPAQGGNVIDADDGDRRDQSGKVEDGDRDDNEEDRVQLRVGQAV